MGYFPFFIDIKGKKGLIIGGGRIAEVHSDTRGRRGFSTRRGRGDSFELRRGR